MARERRRKARVVVPVVLLAVMGSAVLHAAPSLAQVAEEAPDLTLAGTSTAPGEGVRLGARFTYELEVTNRGERRAQGITLLARIPRGLRVVNLLPTIDGGRCSVAGVGARLRFVVICERTVLGPGGWANVSIDVQAAAVRPCRPLVLRARVEAQDEPADLADAANALVLTDGTVCPAISLRAAGPRFAHTQDRVTLRFRVVNLGSTDLVEVRVSDRTCEQPPRRTRGGANGVLSPGTGWTFSCTATLGPRQAVRRVAHVGARGPDGVAVSATDRYVIDVLKPDIRIEVLPSPTAGPPGSSMTQTYRVTNTGNTALRRLRVHLEGIGLVGRIGRLPRGASALLRHRLSLPTALGRVVWSATVVGRDRLGLAVTDTTRSAVEVVDQWPAGPGTAFSGPPHATTAGGLSVLLAIVGVASLLASRRRRSA